MRIVRWSETEEREKKKTTLVEILKERVKVKTPFIFIMLMTRLSRKRNPFSQNKIPSENAVL